jgi:hypothetical protein
MVTELSNHVVISELCSGDLVAQSPLANDIEVEVQRRLYQGAISIEVSISLYLGRKPTLDTERVCEPTPPLDTYEEMEDWAPYLNMLSSEPTVLTEYSPHPAYTLSTFQAQAGLLRICSRILRAFDSDTLKAQSFKVAKEAKASFETDLSHWQASLPTHLRFDRLAHSIPPPHQVELR